VHPSPAAWIATCAVAGLLCVPLTTAAGDPPAMPAIANETSLSGQGDTLGLT